MRTLQKEVRHNFGPGFKKFRDCCVPTANDPVPTAHYWILSMLRCLIRELAKIVWHSTLFMRRLLDVYRLPNWTTTHRRPFATANSGHSHLPFILCPPPPLAAWGRADKYRNYLRFKLKSVVFFIDVSSIFLFIVGFSLALFPHHFLRSIMSVLLEADEGWQVCRHLLRVEVTWIQVIRRHSLLKSHPRINRNCCS